MALIRQIAAQGLRIALRHWRVMLPLYLAGLLFGLAQAWPLLAAGSSALSNPFLDDLAAGGQEAIVDLWLSNPSAVGLATGIWILAALLLAALFGLVYNFFSGGILAAFANADQHEAGAERAGMEGWPRHFWAACRRWFWSFTGLGVLLIVLGAIAAVLGGAVGSLGGAAGVAIGSLVGLQCVNVAGEYARALAVVRKRRNPFALLGMALGFLRRHFLGVLALALLGLLLHAALTALYVLLARAFGGSLFAILWQQVAVLGWLWVKLLRLAWAVSYVRATGMMGAVPPEGAEALPAS